MGKQKEEEKEMFTPKERLQTVLSGKRRIGRHVSVLAA